MTIAAARLRLVSACLALALSCVCGGCRSDPAPKAALAQLALTKAEKQARTVSDPDLLASIGTVWMMVDRKRGHDVLRDAWTLALDPDRFEADRRAGLIVKLAPAWAFTGRDPASAAAILRQALDVVESIKPEFESNSDYIYAFTYEQSERVRLIASLAEVAPDDAIERARRLPSGYRECALRDIALVEAPRDWQRARQRSHRTQPGPGPLGPSRCRTPAAPPSHRAQPQPGSLTRDGRSWPRRGSKRIRGRRLPWLRVRSGRLACARPSCGKPWTPWFVRIAQSQRG